MKEPEDETGQQNSTPVPPFWIRPEDQRGRRVDSRVLDSSYHLWPWAYRHVERELRDGARAAELLEKVAMQVSARLELEPAVARNLSGYLIGLPSSRAMGTYEGPQIKLRRSSSGD